MIEGIGKDYSKALLFMQKRVEAIDEKNRIAIDSMLKASNGRKCSLNDFSYKSRIRSSKDLSILVAFDTTSKELLCSIPYSGNYVDITSFPDFIEKTGIKKGIIITDKGMTNGEGLKDVGYIHPIKRSAKIADQLKLYDMDDKLDDKEKTILCKKASKDGKYYYAFRDLKRKGKEERKEIRNCYLCL